MPNTFKVSILTSDSSSSWRRTNQRVVEEGQPNESFPPVQNALIGVNGVALQRTGHTGTQGLLEEESANDEDEPDD